jgi:hypothetical protein
MRWTVYIILGEKHGSVDTGTAQTVSSNLDSHVTSLRLVTWLSRCILPKLGNHINNINVVGVPDSAMARQLFANIPWVQWQWELNLRVTSCSHRAFRGHKDRACMLGLPLFFLEIVPKYPLKIFYLICNVPATNPPPPAFKSQLSLAFQPDIQRSALFHLGTSYLPSVSNRSHQVVFIPSTDFCPTCYLYPSCLSSLCHYLMCAYDNSQFFPVIFSF